MRAAKEAENKKRENTITYIKTKNLTNNQIANLVRRVRNASPNNFDKIKIAANRVENVRRRAAKEAENKKRENAITYIKTKNLTNNQIANLVQRVRNASPNNFDKIKIAANNAEKEAENAKRAASTGKRPASANATGSALKKQKTENTRNFKSQIQSMKLGELKAYAKNKGYRGYSKLSLQKLRNFIVSKKYGTAAPVIKKRVLKKQNVNLEGGSWEAQLYNILLGKITSVYRGKVNIHRSDIIDAIKRVNVEKKSEIVKNVNQDINLKQYFDILLIIWLDGIHDGYVDIAFKPWYRKQMSVKIPTLTNVGATEIMSLIEEQNFTETLGGLFTYLRNSGDTVKMNLHSKIMNSLIRDEIPKFGAGWEKNIKDFLIATYQREGKLTSGKQINIIKSTDNKGLLLAVDQQYSSNQERTLTRLIDDDNTVGLITFGQALDPGSTMLPGLLTGKVETMMKAINIEPKPGKRTIDNDVDPTTFNGESKYALFGYEHKLKLNGKSVFHVSLTDPTTAKPNLKFNGKELNLTQSAGKAKKANNEDLIGKISKYFGDALQYLLFTHLSKVIAKGERKERYMFWGSGDSMALLGFKIFSEIEGVKPRMIIDGSGSFLPGINCVNLPAGFSLGRKPTAEISEARGTVRGNNGNTAQSKRPKANGPK
jgi:hypothetical protein